MDDAFFEKIIAGTDFSHTTTAAYPSSGALSYESIKAGIAQVEALLKDLPPEPIGEYMRDRGCPPEDGWLLFLPKSLQESAGPFPPPYVRFSPIIREPVILHDMHYQLRTFGTPADYRPLKPR